MLTCFKQLWGSRCRYMVWGGGAEGRKMWEKGRVREEKERTTEEWGERERIGGSGGKKSSKQVGGWRQHFSQRLWIINKPILYNIELSVTWREHKRGAGGSVEEERNQDIAFHTSAPETSLIHSRFCFLTSLFLVVMSDGLLLLPQGWPTLSSALFIRFTEEHRTTAKSGFPHKS